MSWDIFIQDLPDVASIREVPADHEPGPIGKLEDLVVKILEVIPFGDRQDSDWIFATADDIDISLQFHMEDAEQVRYIVAHIHGGAQSAVCVGAILRHLGLRGLDTETAEIFDSYSLDEGL